MSPGGRSGGRRAPGRPSRGSGGSRRRPSSPDTSGSARPAPGVATRRLAADLVARIDTDGAYANLAVPRALDSSGMSGPDRSLVTELVYGTTRRRRACDWLIDRYLHTDPDPPTRALLRVGAYQLRFTDIPSYAVLDSTVGAAPAKTRGFVNAVLRKVAGEGEVPWPDDATRLSYPDWLVDRLAADLGEADALAALEQMDEPAGVTARPDDYVQDLASQWVAASVGAGPGDRVLDVCAAPGGKATAVATSGAWVAAADVGGSRARLLAGNVAGLDLGGRVAVVRADGTRPPWRPGAFDRILLDAPCSGLGALRRRPDARWRLQPGDIDRLAELQRSLLEATIPLVRHGGTLVYSVCTFSEAETGDIDRWLADTHPELEPWPDERVPVGADDPDILDPAPWRRHGRGFLLLPHDADTDGMFLLPLEKLS